jgi:hypothetical protein
VNATLIYRVLIAIRGSWIVVEWFFGWGAHSRVDSLTLLHPYASLVAHAIAVMFLLLILTGLWFFQRWARLIFVLFLAVALVISPFRAHYSFFSPPSFAQAIGVFMLLLTGAIVAMSFLPPVRDCFAKNGA